MAQRDTTGWAGLLALLLSMGCAADLPDATPHQIAEETGIQLGACLPYLDVASTITSIELELVLGGEDVLLGGGTIVGQQEIRCLRASGADCERVRACLGILEVTRGTLCETEDFRCDGDRLSRCVEVIAGSVTFDISEDCAARGQICFDAGAPFIPAGCADAVCGDQSIVCEGERGVVSCLRHSLRSGVCRPGTMCDAAVGTCVGAGAPCTHNRCAGDVFVTCDPINGLESTPIDCAALGQRCITFASIMAAGCGPPEGRTCIMGSNRCEGDVLEYCGNDGATHVYDCVANGYAGCEPRGCTPHSP